MIDYSGLPLAKGEHHWLRGRRRRKDVADYELREKAKVRKRDKRCRWPHCENCLLQPPLEVAHLDPKGMGGDHGQRSRAKDMVLLDRVTHQIGSQSLEQHGRRIEVIDPERGANGPLAFWRRDLETGEEYLVARERAPFLYERD